MGGKHTKLSRKRARSANSGEQEANELRKGFKAHFGSDKVAKTKLVALYVKNHADDAKNPILKHLVRVLERKDGKIHFDDFLVAVRTVESGDKDSQLAWLFNFHDLDGDGQIDKFEMLEIVKTAYGITSRKDKDGSGNNDGKQQTMSPEERLRNTFCTAIDQNSDGVLTRDEFINAYTLNSDVCTIIVKGISDLLNELKNELLSADCCDAANQSRSSACTEVRNGK